MQNDIQEIITILGGINVNGLIDIGSGTGYWRKFFKTIKRLLAIDISKEMLTQSKKEIVAQRLARENRYYEINCSIIDFELENIANYETVFVGFVFSHYSDSDIITILNNIKKNENLKKVIVIDSVYGKYRIERLDKETYKNICINENTFSVYKRYFTRDVWQKILKIVGININGNKSYWGETFFVEVIDL